MTEKTDKNLALKLIYMSTAELLKLADRYADKCGLSKVNA
jgi:hypothetical protein